MASYAFNHGLTPLAVTWKSPGRNIFGRKNLESLISLGVDHHIDYSLNPKVEAYFMLKTLRIKRINIAIPMAIAIYNIPLMIAEINVLYHLGKNSFNSGYKKSQKLFKHEYKLD